ncbi:hypothetical protein ABGB17_27805 [Sphaerisporangium sp. B11E5]|uniref:hypothetical protein n=1 Tax=Sphaerisporangium sp. B11E5 TaxID=3153563 RepID=UPI00325E17CD
MMHAAHGGDYKGVRDMTIKSCPKCNKNNSALKVSGIVARGTSHSSSTSGQIGPTLDGDGLGLAAGESVSTTVQQSLLAQQLTPPDRELKGNGTRVLGWVLFWVALATLALMVLDQLIIGDKNAAGTATSNELYRILAEKDFFPLIFLAFLIGIALIGIGGGVQDGERQKVQAIWNDLYYCPKDDLVYRADNSGKWAPANDLKTILSSGPMRAKHFL